MNRISHKFVLPMRWQQGALLSICLLLMSLLLTTGSFAQFATSKATTTTTYYSHDEVDWLQATLVVKDTSVPLAHASTLAAILQHQALQKPELLPDALRVVVEQGGFFRIQTSPKGLIVSVRGPAELVKAWSTQQDAAPLLTFSTLKSETIVRLCERARRQDEKTPRSNLWQQFFDLPITPMLDENSCHGIHPEALQQVLHRWLSGPQQWLFEGAVHDVTPRKSQGLSQNTPSTTPARRPSTSPAEVLLVSEVAHLLDARSISPIEEHALLHYLSTTTASEVRLEHLHGVSMLLLKSKKPRSLNIWKRRLQDAQQKMTTATFSPFLDAAIREEALFLAQAGNWSKRNATRILNGFKAQRIHAVNVPLLQSILFPSALQGYVTLSPR